MTRMIPIVAVVDEDCFHALNDHISSVEQPTPLLQAAMDRNGWTLDALVAGACLKGALMPDLFRASRRENVEEPKDNPGATGSIFHEFHCDHNPCICHGASENVDTPRESQ